MLSKLVQAWFADFGPIIKIKFSHFQQNSVVNSPQVSRNLYLNIYYKEQCHEGRKLTVEIITFISLNKPSYREYLRPTAGVKPRFGLDLV